MTTYTWIFVTLSRFSIMVNLSGYPAAKPGDPVHIILNYEPVLGKWQQKRFSKQNTVIDSAIPSKFSHNFLKITPKYHHGYFQHLLKNFLKFLQNVPLNVSKISIKFFRNSPKNLFKTSQNFSSALKFFQNF